MSEKKFKRKIIQHGAKNSYKISSFKKPILLNKEVVCENGLGSPVVSDTDMLINAQVCHALAHSHMMSPQRPIRHT